MNDNGALKLIASYGNDSSDEEVPFGRVSTKRCHIETDESKLPVPAVFKKFKKETEWEDNPELHDGRIRSFKHERGNWATYIYVPLKFWDSKENRLIDFIITNLPQFPLKKIDELHITLTRTFVLKYHWIQPFIELIGNNLKIFQRFPISFDSLCAYTNYEKTRTFIGLQINYGYESFAAIVHQLDKALTEYKLPIFYEEPSFHVSLVWCVGDVKQQLESFLPLCNEKMKELHNFHVDENWNFKVHQIICKTGNKKFEFNLT